jgi:RimJ/RimL family protein N-acetyltransferase
VGANHFESERLVLLPHTANDFDDSFALWSDERVTLHIGGKPSTREEVWARVLRYVGHWAELGFGYWTLREKATGRFVGEVGFADFRREMTPPFGAAPEAGWVVMPWAHGRGFATEAVRAAIGWLEAARGRERTVCMINPENDASIRVASKCGYVEYGRTTYKGRLVILHERR